MRRLLYSAAALVIGSAALAETLTVSAAYQPLAAALTSWAAITRATGIDAWIAAPSSANLATATTDETGSGALMFATSPQITTGLEMGHATDTTVTRLRAGAVAVESKPLCYVLEQDGTQHAHTGNTDETTLDTVTIPAGAIGANGSVRVSSTWSVNNDASAKTAKIYFGGTGGTAFLNSGDLASDVVGSDVRWVSNRNATNSQIYSFSQTFGGSGTSTGAVQTSAIDTTAAVDIVFRGTLADGTDSIAVERSIVEICPSA